MQAIARGYRQGLDPTEVAADVLALVDVVMRRRGSRGDTDLRSAFDLTTFCLELVPDKTSRLHVSALSTRGANRAMGDCAPVCGGMDRRVQCTRCVRPV